LPELLSRYADAIFWMGRYIERAENLTRIIDVSLSSAGGRRYAEAWQTLLDINSDGGRFAASGLSATLPEVLRFYVLDDDNLTSIRSIIRAVFENARTLRPFISSELWAQINVFQKSIRELTPAALAPSELPRLLAAIKANCQTHTGIVEGTLHRDQGWYFYQLGRYIERADQTTRLLDARFIRHRNPEMGDPELGSPLESGQWGVLLHCAAGYHAFRRVHSSGMVPEAIASFLLFDTGFPRSVALCANEVDTLLMNLRSRYGLRGGVAAMERIDEIKGAMFQRTPDAVLAAGLHDFLDWIQRQFIGVTNALGADFFSA
jgi:uncharacterized alpha-E superfamily protein